jgi:hypothetical protein
MDEGGAPLLLLLVVVVVVVVVVAWAGECGGRSRRRVGESRTKTWS